MTRAEIFNYIRKNNLQDEVKKMFGKNFTNIKSSLLEDFIMVDIAAKNKADNLNKKTSTNKTKSTSTSNKCTTDYTNLKDKYDSLVEAVAIMLCSIDNENTTNDIQNAIKTIQESLTKG